jgi:hypothetical protein
MTESRYVVVKRFETPDEVVELPGGARLELVHLGGLTLARGSAPSRWRWAEHVGSQSGAGLCPHRHLGMILSGSETIRFPNGDEVVLEPGDVYLVEPGHDSWISSEEPCISLDLALPEE